mgnify:CR=1 FL=1
MSKFLEDLKNAADKGEFNSEAAKKINEISDAAEQKSKMDTEELQSSLKKRMEESPVEPVSEDKISELNFEYEKKMAAIKEMDAVNNQLAVLVEIEDMVRLSVFDMMEHITTIEDKLGEKLDTEPYTELKKKILKIRSTYEQLFIN